MKRVQFFFRSLVALSLLAWPWSLNGCVIVVVKEVVERIVEARTAKEQFIDAQISLRLTTKMEERNSALLFDVNVDVWRGKVMLTSVVEGITVRDEIVRLAQMGEDVLTVYDEIQIIPKNTRRRKLLIQNSFEEKVPLEQKIADAWIEVKIQSQFMAASDVRPVNYYWQSILSRVYIIGQARSSEEKETVLRILRETTGVRDYIEFIELNVKE